MSILITGMEMPLYCDTDCPGIKFRVCPIKELGEALMYRYEEIRHPDCPIVEVPPHGRLIDADAFGERVRIAGGMADEELSDDFKDGVQTTLLLLKSQRTIIETEGRQK